MTKTRATLEIAIVTAAAAELVRLQSGLPGWPALLSPAVWIYLPLVLALLRHRNPEPYGFGIAMWRTGARWAGISIVAVLVPFGALMLAWHPGPIRLPTVAGAIGELCAVAIPEELFFRGYVQGRLMEGEWRSPWLPILLTSGLFAGAHLLTAPGWLRAAVFFPGLIMSWMRARTGGLPAPTIFHWAANLVWKAF